MEKFTRRDLLRAFKAYDPLDRIGNILAAKGWHNTPMKMLARIPDKVPRGYVDTPPSEEPILATTLRLHRVNMLKYLLSIPEIDVNVSATGGGPEHCLDILLSDGGRLSDSLASNLLEPFVNRTDLKYPHIFDLLVFHSASKSIAQLLDRDMSYLANPPKYNIDWIECYIYRYEGTSGDVIKELAKRYKGYSPRSPDLLNYFLSNIYGKSFDWKLRPRRYLDYSDDRELGIIYLKIIPALRVIALS